MSTTVETGTEIRPFSVDVPEDELVELRRRLAATRWPEREAVADESQGVQLATNTGVSSGRLYWENKLGFFDVKQEPELFRTEVRAAFRSVR
jgi:hypothetical protein